MRRIRLLALFLDVLLCACLADVAGLTSTALVWRLLPRARFGIPWIWAFLAAAAILAFLLRDARGGRARKFLALEARGLDGRLPGIRGSIRRNLPLIIPLWNIFDAWPLVKDGDAPRRCDRATGMRILRIP